MTQTMLTHNQGDYSADDFLLALDRWKSICPDEDLFRLYTGFSMADIESIRRFKGIIGVRLRAGTNQYHYRLQLLLGPHYITIVKAFLAQQTS